MNLLEIKQAVENGNTVCWASNMYIVVKDIKHQFMIKCLKNGHCIGLTWADGVTLNGKENDFFIINNNTTSINI